MYEGKERELKAKRPIGLVRSGRSGSRRLRERLVLSVLVVLALAGAVVACPAPSALASSAVSNTLQLGTPEHTKYVTANSDGTYGLHLTFTGESAKRSGADVVIVLDESNSMFAKQIDDTPSQYEYVRSTSDASSGSNAAYFTQAESDAEQLAKEGYTVAPGPCGTWWELTGRLARAYNAIRVLLNGDGSGYAGLLSNDDDYDAVYNGQWSTQNWDKTKLLIRTSIVFFGGQYGQTYGLNASGVNDYGTFDNYCPVGRSFSAVKGYDTNVNRSVWSNWSIWNGSTNYLGTASNSYWPTQYFMPNDTYTNVAAINGVLFTGASSWPHGQILEPDPAHGVGAFAPYDSPSVDVLTGQTLDGRSNDLTQWLYRVWDQSRDWQIGLDRGNTLLNYDKANAPHKSLYEIFITDGEPTSRGVNNSANIQDTHLEGDGTAGTGGAAGVNTYDDATGANYAAALQAANAIPSGAKVYNVFIDGTDTTASSTPAVSTDAQSTSGFADIAKLSAAEKSAGTLAGLYESPAASTGSGATHCSLVGCLEQIGASIEQATSNNETGTYMTSLDHVDSIKDVLSANAQAVGFPTTGDANDVSSKVTLSEKETQNGTTTDLADMPACSAESSDSSSSPCFDARWNAVTKTIVVSFYADKTAYVAGTVGFDATPGVTYTASMTIEPSQAAFDAHYPSANTTAAYPDTGDSPAPNSPYTDADDTGVTSAGKKGFYSNVTNASTPADGASLTWAISKAYTGVYSSGTAVETGAASDSTYPMPVIQTAPSTITVKKTWNVPDHPDSATVCVFQSGADGKDQNGATEGTSCSASGSNDDYDTLVLDSANDWTATITVPAGPQGYTYRVAEAPVSGWRASYSVTVPTKPSTAVGTDSADLKGLTSQSADFTIANTTGVATSASNGTTPMVTKKVVGTSTDDDFRFLLTPANAATSDAIASGAVTLDSGSKPATPATSETATVDGPFSDGGSRSAQFQNIDFSKPGVYSFDIAEQGTAPAGWIYDTSDHVVTYDVTETGGVFAISSVTGNDPLVVNRYAVVYGLPMTGGSTARCRAVLWAGAALALVAAGAYALWKRRNNDK